jgi:hypothetical protein
LEATRILSGRPILLHKLCRKKGGLRWSNVQSLQNIKLMRHLEAKVNNQAFGEHHIKNRAKDLAVDLEMINYKITKAMWTESWLALANPRRKILINTRNPKKPQRPTKWFGTDL